MYPKYFIILLFALLFLISCSSCKSGEGDLNKNNLEKVSEQKMKLVGNPQLSPGTVKIKSLISSIKDDNTNIINVIVEDVLGYGSSAPVVGSKESISIKLTTEQKENILAGGNSVNLVIKQLPAGRGMEESNIWQLISIEK